MDVERLKIKGFICFLSSQEVRYFSETYSSIDRIEATLNESPHDVELWIKLARLKLRQKSDKEEISGEVQERNQRQALSTLSRGLEANRDAQVSNKTTTKTTTTVVYFNIF